ncbi:MAG: hypothetical protein HXX17_02530 [Geobacteraceae bacterium]|nr:hypothetical protein [Geobacteraceae bacterium]
MATGFDFKKLRRLIMIYAVVQVLLVVLLVFVALQFQAGLGPLFWKSVIITLIIQLINFYPIYLFANREAKREIEALAPSLTQAEFKSQRQKRLIGEVIKMSVFAFFLIFAWTVKPAPTITGTRFVYSLIFFNFILTYLTYFQCFNFVAKREMKAKS